MTILLRDELKELMEELDNLNKINTETFKFAPGVLKQAKDNLFNKILVVSKKLTAAVHATDY
tara:strand:+ start:279 stop:464 length:186 start_codon:yes stop_codon:yes gene_type:complete